MMFLIPTLFSSGLVSYFLISDLSQLTKLSDYGIAGIAFGILLGTLIKILNGLREDVKQSNTAFISYLKDEAQKTTDALYRVADSQQMVAEAHKTLNITVDKLLHDMQEWTHAHDRLTDELLRELIRGTHRQP